MEEPGKHNLNQGVRVDIASNKPYQYHVIPNARGFPGGASGKEAACQVRETWVQSLGWEDPLEKGKATHSSILAWRIPWTL